MRAYKHGVLDTSSLTHFSFKHVQQFLNEFIHNKAGKRAFIKIHFQPDNDMLGDITGKECLLLNGHNCRAEGGRHPQEQWLVTTMLNFPFFPLPHSLAGIMKFGNDSKPIRVNPRPCLNAINSPRSNAFSLGGEEGTQGHPPSPHPPSPQQKQSEIISVGGDPPLPPPGPLRPPSVSPRPERQERGAWQAREGSPQTEASGQELYLT